MSAEKKTNNRAKKKRELKGLFNMWLLNNAQACIYSLGQYMRQPVNNLLMTAVIGISLALPASFYVLLDNVRSVSAGWDGSLQVTLFLQNDISDLDALSFAKQLDADPRIESTNLINRDDALAEYRSLSGFADALDALDENPFP